MVERLRGHHFWVVSFFVVVFPRGRGKKAAAVLLVVVHGRRASGGKNGEAHFRISHILLTQNRNAVRECA